MHQSSRRQFVFGVAAGTPFLFIEPPSVLAQTQPSDPVLEAMIADLAELTREGNASPSARKGVLRAAESLTGAMAVHLGQHYDPKLKSDIRRLGRNRQAFVQEVTTKLNKPEFTHDKVEAALKALEKDGFKGALLESRRVLKRARENAPEAVQVKLAQFDWCADVRWYVDLMEMMMTIACSISMAFAGTNFAADLACVAASTEFVMFKATAMWLGC